MKRKEHAITRSEWNRYVAWSNTQHASRAQQVTQRIEDAPIIPQFKQHAAHDVAHNEALTTENV